MYFQYKEWTKNDQPLPKKCACFFSFHGFCYYTISKELVFAFGDVRYGQRTSGSDCGDKFYWPRGSTILSLVTLMLIREIMQVPYNI